MRSVKRSVKRKVKVFGKSIPVLAIVAIVMVAGMGLAAASYLVWSTTDTVTVMEPIVVYTADDTGEMGFTEGALRFLPDNIYAGVGTCATYLIHNEGPEPLTITVTMTEPAGTELAGISLVWATSTADILVGGTAPEFIYLPDICTNTEDNQILSYTFEIGTYDYDGSVVSGGERYTDAKGNSSYVKVYAGFTVKQDAEPITTISMDVQVLRG